MSLLHLAQQQYLESHYLHWYSENLSQNHSLSSWCHSGQKLNAYHTPEETNCIAII